MRKLLLCLLCACGHGWVADAPAMPSRADGDRVEIQLRGHLMRARACIEEAGAGLLEARFTIQPNGRVTDVEVLRNTSGREAATRCLERKIGALYFDPAPPRAITRTERLVYCERGSEDACRLSPVHRPNGRHAERRIAAGVRDLEHHVLACKAEVAPLATGVLSVEVTIGEDGRVRSGWVRHSSSAALRACGVSPLLGARVIDRLESERRVRFTLGLRPS